MGRAKTAPLSQQAVRMKCIDMIRAGSRSQFQLHLKYHEAYPVSLHTHRVDSAFSHFCGLGTHICSRCTR